LLIKVIKQKLVEDWKYTNKSDKKSSQLVDGLATLNPSWLSQEYLFHELQGVFTHFITKRFGWKKADMGSRSKRSYHKLKLIQSKLKITKPSFPTSTKLFFHTIIQHQKHQHSLSLLGQKASLHLVLCLALLWELKASSVLNDLQANIKIIVNWCAWLLRKRKIRKRRRQINIKRHLQSPVARLAAVISNWLRSLLLVISSCFTSLLRRVRSCNMDNILAIWTDH